MASVLHIFFSALFHFNHMSVVWCPQAQACYHECAYECITNMPHSMCILIWCMDSRQDGVKWSKDSKLWTVRHYLFSAASPAYIPDLLCLYPWPCLPISLTFSAYIPDLLCLISYLYPWPSLPISLTSASFPTYIPDLLCLYPWPSLLISLTSASSPAYIPDLLCLISYLYPWPSLPHLLPMSLPCLPISLTFSAYIPDLLCLTCLYSWPSLTHLLPIVYPWPYLPPLPISLTHLLPISLTFSQHAPFPSSFVVAVDCFSFYIVLFSTLQQMHRALVACDFKWTTSFL